MPVISNPVRLSDRLEAKRIAIALRDIEAAWEAEDYAAVVRRSREFLVTTPNSAEAFVHLARAAVLTGDWPDVAEAGAALARSHPKEAFRAAGRLNRAGRSLEAAKIFAELHVHEGWFDAEAAEWAAKDAALLIVAGDIASSLGQGQAAAIIWAAGTRIAPRSQVLAGKIRRLTRDLKQRLAGIDSNKDPLDYLNACREMAWLNPANLPAAVKFARASERSSAPDAIDAWLKVLVVVSGYEVAEARLLNLAAKYHLEDHAIAGLWNLGRNGDSDSLIRELSDGRDVRAKATRTRAARLAVQKAAAFKREVEPDAYLAAWKHALVLAPNDARAIRKVIAGAGQMHDYAALVDAWEIHLGISPDDAAAADRLAAAAMRAGQEQRALDYLARNGLVKHLSKARHDVLCRRVLQAGKVALRSLDFDFALACHDTLALDEPGYPELPAFRTSLANGLAAKARQEEIRNDQAAAVPLAEEALELVPQHPAALMLVARDLWRRKRYGELLEFCRPRVKADPEYDDLREMLDQAALAA